MKKSLLALAALTAFAGAASAQSSVTLFGVVDLSANSIKAGSQSQKVLASSQMNSNRLGFRGVEDLGGGLKASFHLEAGMSNDVGTVGGGNGYVTCTVPTPVPPAKPVPCDPYATKVAGNSYAGDTAFFNRRSTVSLLGNFGEVRLGRDYLPTFWNAALFDVNGANGAGEGFNMHSALGASTANDLVRGNNSVAYYLPAIGGLYGQFTVAAGEGIPGKYSGGRIGYGAGPVNVAFASGAHKARSGTDLKVTNFGGSFTVGSFTLYGYWDKNTYGGAEQKVYEFSGSYQLGAGQVRASVGKTDLSGKNPEGTDYTGQSAKMWGAGYYYDLSKRTTVYGLYGSIKNSGGAGFTVVSTSINSSAKNDTSSAFTLGVKHSF